MKKTMFENETLYYVGISRLYGGWMLTTEGDPVTRNDMEEADDFEHIGCINRLMKSSDTVWEDCTDEDKAYVEEWLEIWGV